MIGRKGKSDLSRYAGKLLVETAKNNPDVLKLGASRRDVTLTFLDIWGFNEITNYASSEAVVDLLCEYFSRMTTVIRARMGFVDKFFGDAIFSIFGAPVDSQTHALDACRAMLDALRETAKLSAEWHLKGFGKIHQSIGVVSGPAIVGNIGTEERAMFTAVGPAVTLTVQLQQASRRYRAPAIIGRETRQLVKDQLLTRELDVIKVAGTDRTATIYELLGDLDYADDDIKRQVDLFQRGLKLFRERDWDRAERRFVEANALGGNDDGPSKLYLRRCKLYRKHPPPPEWDNVHAHTMRMSLGDREE